jgi:hypothetical protein
MDETIPTGEPKRQKVGRPVLPEGYGVPLDNQDLLPWSYIQERMQAARNYWICTVRPDGRPHATPVWGVWIDDVFYFEGSLETRRAQNLLANPAVTVHLESGSEVVILDGEAQAISRPDPALGQRLSEKYGEKYAGMGYSPGPDAWDNGGLFAVHAKTVLAWTKFPQDTTRFQL